MNHSFSGVPAPGKANLLSRLKQLEVPISIVVDVGVRESTRELIEAFPSHMHFLFEPVPTFFADIELNYAAVPHVLFPMALSDTNETKSLVVTALLRDGVATHSRIVDEYRTVDGVEVISCTPIDVRRLDSINAALEPDFLLKVDVDGFDLQVLKGCGSMLSLASAVIVEATFADFYQRALYLESNGFQLIDIVDLVYYGSVLYQFDIVFIRRELINENVRPPIHHFERALWKAFNPK